MQLKFSFVLASLSFFASAAAHPNNAEPKGHEWKAPGPGDVRGPCPGLNTLANHGYLPRNGKQFTVKTLLDAGVAGFNVDPAPIAVAAKFGIMTTDSPTWDRINLDALSAHNIIEHDASISRNDFGDGTGDNTHFNETTFATLANSNPGKDYYDPISAGVVQRDRLVHSLATNNLTVNTQKEFLLRSRESALYLSIFGDPATGIASKEFVNIFFREERLPYKEGFKLPKTLITADSLKPLEHIIRNASEWTQTQRCGPLILGDGIDFNTDTFA
ncbi:Peroxidase, family 2-domain-containing protein [Mycena olivaceomarginata]|nr:Peroxidase, family 2-domain-containing protein [Mycena olivaceomarginata]